MTERIDMARSFTAMLFLCLVFAALQSYEINAENRVNPAAEPLQILENARISYLGPAGTYTEEAAQYFFAGGNFQPRETVPDAIADLINGDADYAVIPQENTLGGAVTNYVDALIREEGVYVAGEVILPINQTLMGIPGASLDDIQVVCSHAQGIAQSTEWRKEHLPDARVQDMASTAAAASYVSESGDKTIAAIAAPGAAELYGLTVLAEKVQITDANRTRFYVLSRTALKGGAPTNAVFTATCGASRIDDILVQIPDAGLELVAIHDRPEGSELGMYRYIIEVEDGNGISEERIAEIEAIPEVRHLGRFNVMVKQGDPENQENPEEQKDQAEQEDLVGQAAQEDRVEQILSEMTLEDKVEQMMVVSFREWKEGPAAETIQTVNNNESDELEDNVTELNGPFREALQTHHFGGAVFFSENYSSAEQTVKLAADFQETTVQNGGLPLFIATDQEGGNVSRVIFGTYGVGNMALAATGDPENAREMGAIYGKELQLLGINTEFGPVLDVNTDPVNPIIGARSFSDDPAVVAEYGLKYIEGLHEMGCMATLKHFPGHGATEADSHTDFPIIRKSYKELQAVELVPFQAAIDAGADMIMTAHIQFPEIEPASLVSISTGEKVYLPATMSHVFMTDILRNDMGFEGVVFSDALDMGAIVDHFSTEDVLQYAVNAGVDMLLLPGVRNAGDFDLCMEMVDTAIRLAESGEIPMERIDESVRRILRMKEKCGLLDRKDFSVTEEMIEAAREGVGSAENLEKAWQIAGEAVTVLKNENDAFPLDVKEGENALILFSENCASRAETGDLVKQILEEQKVLPENSTITVMQNTADNGELCLEAAKEADHVILVYRMYNAASIDPRTAEGASSADFDRIIAARHQAGKKVIVVSCSLPYDAARFPDADGILLTYMSSPIWQLSPENGRETDFAPNLPVALCACFGYEEAKGTVPVKLPELDENYQFVLPSDGQQEPAGYETETTEGLRP